MTRYYEQKARKNALPPKSEQQVAALRAATGAARRMPDPEVGVDFWIETTDPLVIRSHRVFDMKENFLGMMFERRNDDYPYCVVFPNGRQLSAFSRNQALWILIDHGNQQRQPATTLAAVKENMLSTSTMLCTPADARTCSTEIARLTAMLDDYLHRR